MYFDITKAVYVEDYKINLTFENGKNGIVDLSEYVENGDIFSKFSDIGYFKSFYVEDGILTWENGNVDIASETLYLKTTGEKTIYWDIEEMSKAS